MRAEGATSTTIFDPGGDPATAHRAPLASFPNPFPLPSLSDFDSSIDSALQLMRDDPLLLPDYWAGVDPVALPALDPIPADLHYDPSTDPRSTTAVDAEVAAYVADFKANPIRDGVPLRTFAAHLSEIQATGDRIRSGGLAVVLDRAIAGQMQRSCSPSVVSALCHGYPHLDALLTIQTRGLHYHMLPGFRPNGGDGFQQSRSYYRARPLLHHSLTSMLCKGRALAFPLNSLQPEELASLHFSELVHAPKAGSRGMGRTCLHLSRQRNSAYTAINASVDRAASAAARPPQPLPTLRDFADIVRSQRASAADVPLESAYVDLTTAFQLMPLDSASARLTATLIHIPRPGEPDLPVVIVWLVAEWGHTSTAHAFSILGAAIPYVLQRDLDLPVTAIYVDDLPIVAPRGQAREHLLRACEIAVTILGPDSLTLDEPAVLSHFDRNVPFTFRPADRHRVGGPKVGMRGTQHDAIGFLFDLDRWRAYPRRKAIVKMYHLLWRAISTAALVLDTPTVLSTRLLQTVASVLNFYSVVLPSGNACVRSLFACLRSEARTSPLSNAAKRDLAWWRVLIRDVAHEPYRLARDIDSLGTRPQVHRTIVSDASTGTGGGGWLSPPGLSRSLLPTVDSLSALRRLYVVTDGGDHDDRSHSQPGCVTAPRTAPADAWAAISLSEMTFLDTALSSRAPMSAHSGYGTQVTPVPPDVLQRLLPYAAVLRWTSEEQENFGRVGLGINVLEYFSSAYLILLWGPALRGRSVGISGDNTAALAWLASGRYSGTCDAGHDLIHIFYMYCIACNITLVPEHIAGVTNVLADNLSRCVSMQEHEQPPAGSLAAYLPSPSAPTAEQTWWLALSRTQICRRLLTRVSTPGSSLASHQRHEILKRLLGTLGPGSAPSRAST